MVFFYIQKHIILKFVSEATIDRIVEEMEANKDAYQIEDFIDRQPVVLSYLFSDNFTALSKKEKEYMLFLGVIILAAVYDTEPDILPVAQDTIGHLEDDNWDVYEHTPEGSFREKLDAFFKDYHQEDLLAFVEDTLMTDSDDLPLSKEAQAIMFITLKTVIDGLTKN